MHVSRHTLIFNQIIPTVSLGLQNGYEIEIWVAIAMAIEYQLKTKNDP